MSANKLEGLRGNVLADLTHLYMGQLPFSNTPPSRLSILKALEIAIPISHAANIIPYQSPEFTQGDHAP